ncbi:protein-tyrosine phosphatase-like protein [Cyathus striatus]|nr:protein-tyrosine phosphatase-like protein [Cyathus striatus]
MSSCPGKKVRLQGPIRGRSGVCRDLKTDLNRMKDLGVGCIVCCLDDDELQFLGAPWPEYKQLAHETGIDILRSLMSYRIPAPEGLPPIAPSVLDTYLIELIHTYTLRGIPVLVHCRGGVGRAGVIACCWLIKLGLCGWLDSTPGSVPSTDGSTRNDTIQLIAKVIDLVRMRRSLKAIETYEQVRFLVDFVEYLRSTTP